MCLYIISEYEPMKDRNSICSYLAIINHLNLTQDKDRYITTRPVKKYNEFTKVYQFMAVEAILDVVSCSEYCCCLSNNQYVMFWVFDPMLCAFFHYLFSV